MIVCIKVGVNEKATFEKYNKLSKHFDIIDVLPKNKTSMGVQGDKEYLAINIDTDGWNDKKLKQIRWKLREEYRDTGGVVNEDGVYPLKEKRLWKLNDDDTKLSTVGIDAAKHNKIKECKTEKEKKLPFNMKAISNTENKIKFNTFAQSVVNKHTGKTLAEELEL